jgi:hypothetical protein
LKKSVKLRQEYTGGQTDGTPARPEARARRSQQVRPLLAAAAAALDAGLAGGTKADEVGHGIICRGGVAMPGMMSKNPSSRKAC